MKRTTNLAAVSAATILFLAATVVYAQQPVPAKSAPPQSQGVIVPQKPVTAQKPATPQPPAPAQQAAPAQQPAAAQPAPAQKPVAPQPAPVQKPAPAQPAPVEQATAIAPEILIGQWDINVDSYLDTQLAIKGKYEHPAKVELARNLLKSNGMNIRIDFQADGCIGVDKTYCGACEKKKGTWCVECIEGQQMSIEVKGHHGWTRRDLELEVCDDLHIRVMAPKEIAGIYERVPDSVTPTPADAIPPEPTPAEAEPKSAPKNLKSTQVVPKRIVPTGRVTEQKADLGAPSSEITPSDEVAP